MSDRQRKGLGAPVRCAERVHNAGLERALGVQNVCKSFASPLKTA